eukprot:TRINITY_DN6536_c0_g1_i5.p1 TRINITY_DN6536_c0_g1~~TRINITY_DN6536_c0_g1_i5.p1  ORF type:complete len:155 (-),score=25.33 TRINITY_DN6536_c0_g1_i5:239-703(-)
MEFQRMEVRRVEAAWRNFLAAAGPTEVERYLGAASLYLLFKEMVTAVENNGPIPRHDELIVRVAKALLGQSFASIQEVEAVVVRLLEQDTEPHPGTRASRAEDALDAMCQARRAPPGGAGCMSKAAALIDSMLASQGPPPPPRPALWAAAAAAC